VGREAYLRVAVKVAKSALVVLVMETTATGERPVTLYADAAETVRTTSLAEVPIDWSTLTVTPPLGAA
jgi:hypothetical protein